MIAVKNRVPLRSVSELISIPAGVRADDIAEYRLRAGRPACAVTVNGGYFPCSRVLDIADISRCFEELCRYSIHSYSREIREGYITLDGGHRVGFCGTAVIEDEYITTLRDISSVNIRIAREVRGCAEALYNRINLYSIPSLLIAGSPMSGKTTLLRDLARLIGDHYNTALIDSRGEIAASAGGVPSLDVGKYTDVLNGYPRTEGMAIALRTLSPRVMICDEISTDAQCIRMCANSGASLVATVHAADIMELRRRRDMRELLPLFDYIAVIGGIGEAPILYSADEVLQCE